MRKFNIGICDDMKEEAENIKNLCEELLFLDIEMKEKDGIEVLRELEHSKIVWKVVFVSRHQESVFDAFGIKTLGFEKKPVKYEKIEKWLKVLIQEHKENFWVECKGLNGKQYIQLEKLYYLKADKNYVKMYGKEKEVLVYGNLKTWEEKLAEKYVIRVHKTYMVNMIQIDTIAGDILLKNGRKIPVGRRYKDVVQKQYHEYICKMTERRI